MKYSILDPNGLCVNFIFWDNQNNWQPPIGHTLVAEPFEIGKRYLKNPNDDKLYPEQSADPTPNPKPQWVQFGALLAGDSSVNAMVATAAASYPVLHLMLGVGLGQAAQGDPQTFAAAWGNAKSLGLVSSELAEHVAEVGSSLNLPQTFLATITS
jgi:hypothetical protein